MAKKKIIISINPEHVVNIINGTKKYEYRKKAAKNDISSILIYETTPIKKVVAEAEIIEVLSDTPDRLWDLTKEYSGVNKQFFDEYFKGRTRAFAYKLGKIKVFENPIELTKFGVKTAPQSFVYIN